MPGFVFVLTYGSHVSKDGDTIAIVNDKGKVKIPVRLVRYLFMFSGTNISSPALNFLLRREKYVFFLDRQGKIKKISVPKTYLNKKRNQYMSEGNRQGRLRIMKLFLTQKAKGVGSIMDSIESRKKPFYIKNCLEMVLFKDIEEALQVSKNFDVMLLDFLISMVLPEEFAFLCFKHCSKRNSGKNLLSLVYSLYHLNLVPLSISMGLDPFASVFRERNSDYAPLCFDILEFSRPWLMLFVFKLFQDGFFVLSDFELRSSGYFLKTNALKAFLKICTEKILLPNSKGLIFAKSLLESLIKSVYNVDEKNVSYY